jgi:hypothetical protein
VEGLWEKRRRRRRRGRGPLPIVRNSEEGGLRIDSVNN